MADVDPIAGKRSANILPVGLPPPSGIPAAPC